MKGLLTELGMNTFTLIALIISFAAFVGILIWVTTRSQSEMDAQARLYEDGSEADGTAEQPAPDTAAVGDSGQGDQEQEDDDPREP